MRAGQELGVYAAWHNDSGPEIPVAYWRIVMYLANPRLRPSANRRVCLPTWT